MMNHPRMSKAPALVAAVLLAGCGGGGGGSDATAVSATAVVAPAPQPSQLVAFIGDSITSQWVVTDCIPTAINAGVPGNFTWQIADRIRTDVLDKYPNVTDVVILGGTNDVAGGAFFPVGTDDVYRAATLVKNSGKKPWIGTIPPNSSIPTTWGWGPNIVPEWNTRVKAMATQFDFKVINFYPLFVNTDGSQNTALYFPGDAIHPNKDGDAAMCATVKAALGL
jgi:lysophospholipase L1-like esterase